MYYYAISIRCASFIMVNSSWTKSHIDAILQHSDPLLDLIHLLPPLFLIRLFTKSRGLTTARTVYPPCDTREIAKFPLEGREPVILSVAQFRFVPLGCCIFRLFHIFLRSLDLKRTMLHSWGLFNGFSVHSHNIRILKSRIHRWREPIERKWCF